MTASVKHKSVSTSPSKPGKISGPEWNDDHDVSGLSEVGHGHSPSEVTGTAIVEGDARLSNARTPTTHSHAPADVTGTAVITSDSRLSDARTPLTHAHAPGDVTGTAVITNDARLSDARMPNSHDSTKHSVTYALPADISTHAALTTGVHGAGANSLIYSNDSRLTDARTPTAHGHVISDTTNLQTALDGKAPSAQGVTNGNSHDHNGGDGAQIAYSSLSGLPSLGTIADNAETDFAVASKGVTNGDSHDHAGGDGAVITDANLSFTDVTTNDVSITKHGFAPKAPNVSTKYLAGNGNWVDLPTTGTGYAINVQALTSSPTDAQTIYFGTLPKAPVTVAATSKIYIRKAGTIKIAEIYCYSGTAGTNEAWSIYIRKNNTTDTLIATLSVSASERVFSNAALSIAVAAGDYIEIKSINPTWGTNPLTTIFGGYIYIE
jgi:hypothetical protein